jgi:hypothetical protein
VSRAAGDDTHYTWELQGRPGLADIRLPSVTTIIKTVFSGSFVPASSWGFKLGFKAALPDTPEDELETLFGEAKAGEHSPDSVRDAARDRGTRVHEFFEALANDPFIASEPSPMMGETVDGYEESVVKWWQTEMPGWEVVASEVTLVSIEHQFAGTVDLIRCADGFYEVIDLKTHSGSARYEDRLQVAAYELAAREMGLLGDPLDNLCNQRVVLAREDGRKAGQSTKYTNPEEFLKVLEVYKAMKGVK